MKWHTLKEAASHMRRSERWMRAKLSDIPHYRMEGRILFNESELDAYLEQFKIKPRGIDLRDILDRAGCSPKRQRRRL